jgi:hypothetical protein
MFKLDLDKLTSMKSQKKIARQFELFQNYPNPFNPKTQICYSIGANYSMPLQVELTVFNALGQKVCTLINEKQTSGMHLVRFDAGGLASGIYYYQLKLGNQYSQIRKMVLVK